MVGCPVTVTDVADDGGGASLNVAADGQGMRSEAAAAAYDDVGFVMEFIVAACFGKCGK